MSGKHTPTAYALVDTHFDVPESGYTYEVDFSYRTRTWQITWQHSSTGSPRKEIFLSEDLYLRHEKDARRYLKYRGMKSRALCEEVNQALLASWAAQYRKRKERLPASRVAKSLGVSPEDATEHILETYTSIVGYDDELGVARWSEYLAEAHEELPSLGDWGELELPEPPKLPKPPKRLPMPSKDTLELAFWTACILAILLHFFA